MAFNWDTNGSSVAVLPLSAKGRQNRADVPLIRSADTVTDLRFSPFDDGLLATGSQDAFIKLWRIPESGSPMPTAPLLTLPRQGRRVETVDFHPLAESVLATSSAENVTVWNLQTGKELFAFHEHGDQVQSVSWNYNTGRLIATQCKDRHLRFLDPRQNRVAAECDSHDGIKDSRVVWVGDDRVLTSGFSPQRLREIIIRDMRNLSTPQKELPLDMSSGILVPLFDPDTNMCFLSGKGDRNVQFVEVTDRDRAAPSWRRVGQPGPAICGHFRTRG